MGGKKKGGKKVFRIQPTIWSASRDGNIQDLTAILEGEVDINELDNLGWAPLHYACLEGRREAVVFLLDHGADINKMTEGIQTEIGGFDKNYFEIQYIGVTPIHIAVRKGFNAIVSELIRRGADPTIYDLIGQTALQFTDAKTMSILNFDMSADHPPEPPKEEGEEGTEEV